jgi:hypothetical protein
MNIQLPDPNSYGGAVLSGWTVNSTGGTEKLSGCVIVKAAYDLVGTGGAQKAMVRSKDKARFDIVYQDAGVSIIDTKGTADPSDDEVVGFDLEREADIALQKARIDIVVEGWSNPNAEGQVRIDGTQWLFRAATATGAPDVSENLFGWHSRTENGRKTGTAANFKPVPGDELPPEYGPVFNNVYRRSTGFTAIAASQAQSLPSGKVVGIFKTVNGTETSYAIVLPDLAMKARLRAWCGDCPDEPKRWCVKDTIPLVPDTLIVDPVGNQAEILWRGRFDWDEPGTAPNTRRPVEWRLAQVMEGVV